MIRSFPPRLFRYILWTLSILTLALMAWAVWLRFQSPYDGVQYSNGTSTVTAVDPAGPAAGLLESGDRILTIGGKPISQLTALHLGDRPGDRVAFTIDRQESRHVFEITLARYPGKVILTLLFPILVSLFFWFVGILVLILHKETIQARVFILICLLASASLAAGSVSLIGPTPAKLLFYLLLWWPAPLLFHFHLLFPRSNSSKRLGTLKTFLYAIAIPGTLLDLIYKPAIVDAGLAYSALYAVRRIWLAGGFLAAVLLIVGTYRREPAGDSRSQIGVVALGGLLAFVPMFSFTLIPAALSGSPLLPYQASFLFLTAMPAAYGYAIFRYRLMPVDRYVNRSITSLLLFSILVGLYLVINAALVRLIPAPLNGHPVVMMVLVLVMAALLVSLQRRLRVFVDHLFYGGWYDYQSVVTKVSQTLEPVTDPESLAQALAGEIQTAMQLECACIGLMNGKEPGVSYQPANLPCASRLSCVHHLPAAGIIVPYFQSYPAPVESQNLSRRIHKVNLSTVERDLIACRKAQLWIPIKSGSQVTALLILGPKKGGERFTANDLEILEVVSRQTGIALDKLRLVAELSERDTERMKLHQQALRAAEKERKRLARELHDQIIQDLVGFNFHLAEIRRPLNPDMQAQVDQRQSEIRAMIGNLRGICADLRPPALDSFGLAAVVRSQVRLINDTASFHTALEICGDETTDLPEEIVICVYRVLQEALLNATKHSEAQQVQVKLALSPNHIDLTVCDDGKGFIVPGRLGRLTLDDHFGLLGMYEQVELANGKLSIQSGPGQGCRIDAQIPLPKNVTTSGAVA